MSELYELPEGWEWEKLETTCEIIGGGTPSKKEKSYWDNGTIRWATVGDMNVQVIEETALSITENGLENSSTNIIPKEAIVIATRVGLGKVCYLKSDTAINQDLKGLVPKIGVTTKEFLFYFFRSRTNYIVSNGTGATVKGVKVDFVKQLNIPLPPLPEQKRIVAKLDFLFEKIDRAIALHQKNMDEANGFMGSVLNDVFGELEGKYDLKTIETFSKVGTGVTPLKSKIQYYENGNINWITSKATNFDFVYDCEQLVTDIAINECRLKIYPIGTIIVALYGQGKTRGQVSELMIETATNQAIATIVVDDNQAVNRYLKYFLKKSYIDLRRKASGGTQPNLNLTIIKNIELPLPPLNIQQKTVTYLDKISEKIEKTKTVQKEKLKSLEALKASILDQAFKGAL